MKRLICFSIIGLMILSSCGSKKEVVKELSSIKPNNGDVLIPIKNPIPLVGNKENSDPVFVVVEEMPCFPGGLDRYFEDNLRYPVIAQENGITGRVFVNFIIEKDGSVTNVKILRPIDPSLDKEAFRLISTMSKWIPGKQRGKNVRVNYTIPINFQLIDFKLEKKDRKILKRLNAAEYIPIKEPNKEEKLSLTIHNHYSFCFNEKYKQSEWVIYGLSPDYINGNVKIKEDYRVNKNLPDCPTLGDYKKSGYVKAQLCPAESMKIDKKAMSETFLMGNICPQKPEFNKLVWKKLEGVVRKWALKEKELYVISGSIFKDNLGTMGKNKVTVPGYFYKVIYDATGKKKMIALLMKHEESNKPLKSYAISVDKLEEITGIDYFPFMDDEIEKTLEADFSSESWDWE